MKKNLIMIMASALLILAIGCQPIIIGGKPTPQPTPTAAPTQTIPEGLGAITVTIPGSSSKAVTPSMAQMYSDVYEVIVMKETGDTNTTSGSGSKTSAVIDSNSTSRSKTLYLEPGNYKVLVLAGRNAYSSAYLLGSSITRNVTIVKDQTTSLNVLLDSISFSFDVPAKVDCGSAYTVKSTINLNSPVLSLNSSPSFRISGDSNGSYPYYSTYYFDQDGNGTGNSTVPGTYNFTKILIAGNTEGNATVTYNVDSYRSYLRYNDTNSYYGSTYLHYLTTKTWYSLNATNTYYLPAALKNEVVKQITFVPSNTKLNVNIGWK